MDSSSYSSFRAAGAFGPQDPDESDSNEPIRCAGCNMILSSSDYTTEVVPPETVLIEDEYGGGSMTIPVFEVINFPCYNCGVGHSEKYYR